MLGCHVLNVGGPLKGMKGVVILVCCTSQEVSLVALRRIVAWLAQVESAWTRTVAGSMPGMPSCYVHSSGDL